MTKWPTQRECDEFYGDPRGSDGNPSWRWEADHLVRLVPPYRMLYAGQPISSFRIHKKCYEATMAALEAIRDAVDGDPKELAKCGANVFGGSYNFRLMRGSNKLSMHSWGCAIDLDPARNAFHDETPNFANYPFVISAFEKVGAVWGGRWKGRACDGMHFQFATVS